MEIEWTREDEEAAREGFAISKSLKNLRPRKPHGVNKKDIQRQKEALLLEKMIGK